VMLNVVWFHAVKLEIQCSKNDDLNILCYIRTQDVSLFIHHLQNILSGASEKRDVRVSFERYFTLNSMDNTYRLKTTLNI
jgi:hypothetical protein